MKRFRRSFCFLSAAVFFAFAACAHYPVNAPLMQDGQAQGYSFERLVQPPDADETFVALTFSGGGTRAAALAYGVLEKMRHVALPGKDRTLLEEVDVISTVSGGSFTGAYYALYGERLFQDFRERFLERDIQGELVSEAFHPANWFRLASPTFSRIDLAAELYDRTLFEGRTFLALAQQAKRPFLIVNATNVSRGSRFEFTSDQFRYLGSDILPYPVSRAVAASSAFPFLLSPLSLVNYPLPADGKTTEADQLALKDYWHNRGRYESARNNALYADDVRHPFVHLMDGGLADNLGLRAVYDLYLRKDIRRLINSGEIKRFLAIVVNARAESPGSLDTSEKPPSLPTVAYKTATVAMDNYTAETIEGFRRLIEERARTQAVNQACQALMDRHGCDGYRIPPLAGGAMKFGVVDIGFDGLADPGERAYFHNLPTSFSLTKDQVGRLIEVGGRLLEENPDFRRFMQEAF